MITFVWIIYCTYILLPELTQLFARQITADSAEKLRRQAKNACLVLHLKKRCKSEILINWNLNSWRKGEQLNWQYLRAGSIHQTWIKLEGFFLRKRWKKDLAVWTNPLYDRSVLTCDNETRKMEENICQSFVTDLLF